MDPSANPGSGRLAAAEAAALRAYQRLRSLRLAALRGHYQPDEFDAAVAAYREAEAALDRARDGATTAPYRGQRAAAEQRTHAIPGAHDDDLDEAPPLEITPRLRFVKWLVDTGRLSDDR